MTNEECLQILNEEIEELGAHRNELQDKIEKLEKARLISLLQIIKEQQLLRHSWTITRLTTHSVGLTCVDLYGDLRGLKSLLGSNDHGIYCFKNCILRISNETVSLELSIQTAKQFVIDHGIVINTDDIRMQIVAREKEIIHLNELLEFF